MFHLYLFFTYLIPGIYIFFRVSRLFIPKQYKTLYIVIYLLLFLIYIISNFFGDDNPGHVMRVLQTTSNYLLPFYLYIFLFVLLIDIFLLVNLAFHFIRKEKILKQSFRNRIFLSIILLSVIIVTCGVINFNTIRITNFRITVPCRSSDLDKLKIAFVSDFHLKENTPSAFVEKFVKKIEAINPDIMLFGGDIVEGDREDRNMQVFEKLFSRIRTPYGVYGVLGNHEHYASQDRGTFFNKAGITLIKDSAIIIKNSFIVIGRNDLHTRTRKSIDDLMRSIPDSLPVIVLDHRPTDINNVKETKADIQLSGHTHNGQLFPINLIVRSEYTLSYGLRKIGNTYFFVSSGIRLWGPPVRTTGKSEILVIEVKFTK